MNLHSLLGRGGAQLWTWRGFIFASAVRELRSRYSRSLFGWLWLLLPPLVLIAIYTLVFSRLMRGAGLPGHGPYSYSIFLCAGMLTWQWFAELLSRLVGLFTNYATLIKKTAVPWFALLSVDLLVTGFGLAVQLGLFALLLVAVDQWPGWRVALFLPLLFTQAVLAVGLGLGLAVFQVFFRDVGMSVPLVLQVWFWMTPIVYPIAALPAQFQSILEWNIATPLVQSYQSIVLSPDAPLPWRGVGIVLALGVLALLASLRLVRRNAGLIRDEI
jgi:lipopolysaccharide transport system permease protein